MKAWLIGLTVAVAATATPAHARWRVAESENFVIYAEDSEKDLMRFGDQLERYHSAMELLTGRDVAAPSPSNRLTVYVAGSQRDIRRLSRGSRQVAGFYSPRAGGSAAFVQDVRVSAAETDFSMTVLLHEYAHHFLISTSRHALPRWLSEGAAEFYASARFPRDGEVEIGRPAMHRAGELLYSEEVPLEEVFEYGNFAPGQREQENDFYGRSWLLFHYLTFGNAERRGQMSAYWQAVSSGTGSLEAARQAFGDINVLSRELAKYLKQKRMSMAVFGPDQLSAAPIRVRELSDGMDAVMDLMIESKRGVTREEAIELVPQVRAIAARYPGDANLLAVLAEAEFDAGNDDAAIAGADAALAIDPSVTNAYVQKGYALFNKAQSADVEVMDAAYKTALQPFLALNAIETDHPIPLIYFYRSYTERGAEPNENARHALERASELAPFDQGLTLSTATMLAQEGKIALAKLYLSPLMANPHGGSLAGIASQLDGVLEDAEEGVPVDGATLGLAMAAREATLEGVDGGDEEAE